MKTRLLAQGGILTGFSIIGLYFASFMQIASWAITMLIGFIPAVFFLRGEFRVGVTQYLATALVALMVVPDKSIAILYAFFFGFYTVLKFFAEKRWRKKVAWLFKLVFAELWIVVIWKLIQLGMIPELPTLTPSLRLGLLVVGALFILYYDFCLSKIFAGLCIFLYRIKF